jgi:hypothetical protein
MKQFCECVERIRASKVRETKERSEGCSVQTTGGNLLACGFHARQVTESICQATVERGVPLNCRIDFQQRFS